VKPGPRDVRVRVTISGAELRELKRLSWAMVESFGLDRRIDAYKGTRPIELYRWDLDCLATVLDEAVRGAETSRRGRTQGLRPLRSLQARIHSLRQTAYEDLKEARP